MHPSAPLPEPQCQSLDHGSRWCVFFVLFCSRWCVFFVQRSRHWVSGCGVPRGCIYFVQPCSSAAANATDPRGRRYGCDYGAVGRVRSVCRGATSFIDRTRVCWRVALCCASHVVATGNSSNSSNGLLGVAAASLAYMDRVWMGCPGGK